MKGIYNVAEKLKDTAIRNPMVGMSSFGDIQLYNNKASIKYPYVNFDIVSSYVSNFVKTYTMRIYSCDRNEPYIAYNKAEMIIDDILKRLEIDGYTVNYFTLNFKDMINGCWADFEIETSIVQDECDYTQLLSDTAENFYDIDSNGDFIINN